MATNSKRIAKNTLMLYFRMILLTLISLYTVRVTLAILGSEDFGIYNVVASVVTMLNFFTGTMTSATQRFFAYSLGKNDLKGYNDIFSIIIILFSIISFIVIIIGGLVGGWAVESVLVIPENRMNAALVAFVCSLFMFLCHVMMIPYTASIIAHEHMQAFAYISVADGVMKLLLVYLLSIASYDKLIVYSALMAAETLLILFLYYSYCRRKYSECRFRIIWKKAIVKQLFSYTGWSLFGGVSGILKTQGQNILLNIFFGPIVNAAKAIADKIYGVITSFSQNFYMAVSPQIVMNYATGEKEEMVRLAFRSSKYSFFLLLLLSSILFINTEDLLLLWLGADKVNDEMLVLTQLSLVYAQVSILEQPITQMIRATGDIKRYEIAVGTITLSFIPVASIFLLFGAPAWSTMIILIIIYAIAHIARLLVAKKQLAISIKTYLTQVIFPISLVFCLVIPAMIVLANISSMGNMLLSILLKSVLLLLFISAIIYFVGMNSKERSMIKQKVESIIKK